MIHNQINSLKLESVRSGRPTSPELEVHVLSVRAFQAFRNIPDERGRVTLFNVGSSFSYETGINGSRRCALYPLPLSVHLLRVFKAMATRIRGKSKQTLKSLKIEPETSRSESRALANWHDCSNWNVVELLFRGENLSSQRKTSRSREENQQQTRAPYVTEPETRVTLVGGECFHHCAIPAPARQHCAILVSPVSKPRINSAKKFSHSAVVEILFVRFKPS